MNQTLATVIGLLALAFVIAVPITLMKVLKWRTQRAFARLAEWAQARGLAPSRASAVLAGHAAHVASLSYALDDGVLSLSFAESRGRARVSFYYRPRTRLPGGDFTVQRRSFGVGGRAVTGDRAFDECHVISALDDAAWRALLRPEVRAQLVMYSDEAWVLSHYDGTLLYVQEGALDDPAARDRALQLLRLIAAAPASHGGSGLSP